MSRPLAQILRNLLLAIVIIVVHAIVSGWLEGGRVGGRAGVDLGTVRHPAYAGTSEREGRIERATHDWMRPKAGDWYRLAFIHGREAVAGLEADHARLARHFAYQELDDDRFMWSVPPDCGSADAWPCIYARVLHDSGVSLDTLAARFREHFVAASWSEAEAARWLLAFVQEIPYRLPTEHPFGILPPALVASRDWGDCDSKSLLYMALLERLGIGSVLMISDAHAHAMVGVEVRTGRDDAFVLRGREYAWAETTARLPLGLRSPELRSPDDWRPVLLR